MGLTARKGLPAAYPCSPETDTVPGVVSKQTLPHSSPADLAAQILDGIGGCIALHGDRDDCPDCVRYREYVAALAELERQAAEARFNREVADAFHFDRGEALKRALAAEAEVERLTRWHSIELREREAAEARAQQLEEALRACLDDLIWMSGSESFSPGGEAEEGWKKVRERVTTYFAVLAAGPSVQDGGSFIPYSTKKALGPSKEQEA